MAKLGSWQTKDWLDYIQSFLISGVRSSMGAQKLVGFLVVVPTLIIVSLIFYDIKLNQELRQRDAIIQNLKLENAELQNESALLKVEIGEVKSFLKSLSEAKELRNPTWEELKLFIEVDLTNELVYNKSFDCSGFAIELFKRARAIGLRCGFVEVEFREKKGHTLNVFQTDKGLIFVDMTGNEAGTGKDKIAYVQVGKPYGTIELDGISKKRIACKSCPQFARELSYATYSNPFDYEYFLQFKQCIGFYEGCVDEYNRAVEEYNRGSKKYTHAELQKWLRHLKALEKELGRENIYLLSESGTIKTVQIYW